MEGRADESGEVRVLIVDDHTVVRDGLKALLTAEQGMVVVGAAGDGQEAIGPRTQRDRVGHARRHVVRALLLQVIQKVP